MIGGYIGKTLIVDLSRERVITEPTNEEFAATYIGGSGYACRLALDHLTSATEPLGPENVLIFVTGPLVGTAAPIQGGTSCVEDRLSHGSGGNHTRGESSGRR